MSDGRDWVQFDIGSANPGLILADWADWAPDAIETGTLCGFWFMQKPPGLRLRVAGDRTLVERHLREVGATFQRRRYCLEAFLFDGPPGIRAAHDFFTLDSLAVIGMARALRDRAMIDPEAASIALVEHLLCTAPLDSWERWDVWMRTLVLRGGDWRAVRPRHDPLPRSAPLDHGVATGVTKLFERINAEGEAVVFPSGLRAILPFWIVFHWNRMGFDAATQCRLAARQAARKHPRAPVEAVSDAWALV